MMETLDLQRAELMLQARAAQLGVDAPHVRSGSDTFPGFVDRHNPTLQRFEHIPRLLDVGERVLRGELKRVLVLMPPRYLKSEVFSRLLPAEFLRRSPELWCGLASYGASLAWDLSAEARNNFQADGGRLLRHTKAKKHWRTAERGGMWAAGVGGPMLGFGYHLGIVDDPTDPEKASSPTYQARFESWWAEKFLSRQEPGASIVFVMQRLGPDDPVDFLFRRELGEETDEAPEHWHVVACEEMKSDAPLGRWHGPRGLPETCTIEPDPRESGEILAPTRFNRQQVEKLQQTGTYVVAAQRQQRPAAPEGDFWKEHWFEVYDDLPADAFNGGRDWDTAFTKDDQNSASAWIESYRGPDRTDSDGKPILGTFPIYIAGCGWDWWEFPELVEEMKSMDGPHYIEAKASGKSAKQSLKRERIPVEEVEVEGDKLARASGVQPIVSRGQVFVHRSVIRRLLHGDRQGLLRVRAEMLAAGRGDLDLNDVFVQALTRHVGKKKRRFGVYYPGMEDDGDEEAA